MERTQSGELVELWARVHSTAPALRATALLGWSNPDSSLEDLARLSIGERDRQLSAMRKELFRNHVAAVAQCPECGTALDLEFSLSDLNLSGLSTSAPTAEANWPFQVLQDGYSVIFRLPTTEDLSCLARSMNVDQAKSVLLNRCVLTAKLRGTEVRAAELPDEIVKAIEQRMGDADPAGDIGLQVECPACAQRWHAPFDIGAFLWTEIDDFVRRRLVEVHELALAYGWAESEILSMPPPRRNFYLQMVRG